MSYATVATTPEIDTLLARDAAVAIGISGGKDSLACAFAVQEHLDKIGHKGPRCLIHSDLGSTEWKQSLPKCRELAEAMGWELVVIKRAAGDMMDRWLTRFENNKARYFNLQIVKMILPWSTAQMRFCSSEMKSALISSALKKKFPGQDVVNVVGVRRDESPNRFKMPVAKANPACANKGGVGISWNAIIEWPVTEVYEIIKRRGLELHEAYVKYGMSRVSCCFCVLSSAADLLASTTCPDNLAIYRRMVELECNSTYSFQSGKWLGDVNPEALGPELCARVAAAKLKAAQREMAEARIPKHLLFEAGWPNVIPTLEEAQILAEVRREVAAILGLTIQFTDAESIVKRFEELMAAKVAKNGDQKESLIPVVQLGTTFGPQLGLF